MNISSALTRFPFPLLITIFPTESSAVYNITSKSRFAYNNYILHYMFKSYAKMLKYNLKKCISLL